MNTANLDTYLQRIGHTGASTTTLETLTEIHHAHACSIAFENLDPWLGVPVRLDPSALHHKLVRGQRGGFCYEHNALLGAALRTLGFSVTDLAARVLWNMPAEMIRPRTHMLLVVDLNSHQYVVDAGFGGMTLTAPLRLHLTTPQATPHGPFRLQPTPIDRVLQAEVAGEWKSVYRFDLQRSNAPTTRWRAGTCATTRTRCSGSCWSRRGLGRLAATRCATGNSACIASTAATKREP